MVGRGEKRNSYRLLVGKPEGNRILKRARPIGECNIKINVKEVGLQGMGCIHLDQGTEKWQPFVKVAMSLRVPYKGKNYLIK